MDHGGVSRTCVTYYCINGALGVEFRIGSPAARHSVRADVTMNRRGAGSVPARTSSVLGSIPNVQTSTRRVISICMGSCVVLLWILFTASRSGEMALMFVSNGSDAPSVQPMGEWDFVFILNGSNTQPLQPTLERDGASLDYLLGFRRELCHESELSIQENALPTINLLILQRQGVLLLMQASNDTALAEALVNLNLAIATYLRVCGDLVGSYCLLATVAGKHTWHRDISRTLMRMGLLTVGVESSPHPTRKVEHVVTVYNGAFFDNSGLPTAAIGVADYWNASFQAINADTLTGSAVADHTELFVRPNLVVILVAAFGNRLSVSDFRAVKHHSSILLCYGGDTIYAHQRGAQCEFEGCDACDVYLDLVDSVVARMRGFGFKSHPWIWTPSSTLLAAIENKLVYDKSTWRFARDALLTKMTAPVHLVLLIRLFGEYRLRLRDTLLSMSGFELVSTEQFIEPDAVFDIYGRSFATISTTSSSWDGGNNCRSVKGFRDWIAPSLGCLLFTDDHPDNLRKYGPHVFYYRYGDFDNLRDTVQRVWTDLNDHPERVSSMLEEQRAWVYNNTLDVQILHTIDEYWSAGGGTPTTPSWYMQLPDTGETC